MKPLSTADQAILKYGRDNFHYNPETGELWRLHPTHSWRVRAKTKKGYLKTKVRTPEKQQDMLAHRLCWFLQTGTLPPDQIDHRNGIRDDNRFSNLRCATNQQNQLYRGKRNPTSKYVGVLKEKSTGRFEASVYSNGRVIYKKVKHEKNAAIIRDQLAYVYYGNTGDELNFPNMDQDQRLAFLAMHHPKMSIPRKTQDKFSQVPLNLVF